MEYLEYLILFAAGFYIGYKVNEKIMYWTFARMLEQADIKNADLDKFIRHWAPKMGDDADQVLGTEPVKIKVEQHGGMLYAYTKDADEFLAQAADGKELVDIIAQRFKDTKFTITKEDGAAHLNITG